MVEKPNKEKNPEDITIDIVIIVVGLSAIGAGIVLSYFGATSVVKKLKMKAERLKKIVDDKE